MLYFPGSLQQICDIRIYNPDESGKDLSKDPIHLIDVALEGSPVHTRKTALLDISKQKNKVIHSPET